MTKKAKRIGALASVGRDAIMISGMGLFGYGGFLFHPGLGFMLWGVGVASVAILLVPGKRKTTELR